MKKIAVLLLALALGGCFSSANNSFYAGVTPLHPFHDGRLVMRDKDGKLARADNGKPAHLTLRTQADGIYRLTISDPGKDLGEGYLLKFFPLPGASSSTLIFEVVQECKAQAPDCKPAPSETAYLYGLARLVDGGVEEVVPDCSKDDPIAKWPGVVVGGFDTCTFPDRASLEKALLLEAKRGLKPDAVYRFE